MSTPSGRRGADIARAVGCAALAVALTVATAILALEIGLIDDSHSIRRAIPALASVVGVLAYLWKRDQGRTDA